MATQSALLSALSLFPTSLPALAPVAHLLATSSFHQASALTQSSQRRHKRKRDVEDAGKWRSLTQKLISVTFSIEPTGDEIVEVDDGSGGTQDPHERLVKMIKARLLGLHLECVLSRGLFRWRN